MTALALPRPAQKAVARARLDDVLAETPDLAALPQWPDFEPLALGLADQSPFLWGLIRRDPERLKRILQHAPEAALDAALAPLAECAACPEARAMTLLRKAKQESAVIIALADLSGGYDVVATTRALSRAADALVGAALRSALYLAGDKLGWAGAGPDESKCGLTILALGKHGARELNYSSDVDLVVFFDAQSPVLDAGPGAKANAVRLTQHIVKLLNERTGDGYVLRVDLRLRPDPGSTAVAVSLDAARHYYEALGQNWERAAFIKARPIAGDLALGMGFLDELSPFIWRKYFDYAAIADVHAMKRQIHAVKGHAEIAVAGHDVKLGRGGIREIEFFVQTQQLIFGGRRKQLRGSRTLDMLQQLQEDQWITPQAAAELGEAYAFLRGVEHRLQMLNDQQTQRLPADEAALKAFSRFCGFPGAAGFAKALTKRLRAVEKHYARLFENAPGLDSRAGSLVFTGSGDDPDTLDTLREMGFRDPARAAETVRGWHFGRRPAVRSPRAREVLTELIPALLNAFAKSGDADSAIAAFDEVMTHMPAAVELFSLLKSHDAMRQLFADILGGAPRLAEVVAQTPNTLDAAIDQGLTATVGDEDDYLRRLAAFYVSDPSLEGFLDIARTFATEEKFLIGLRLFAELIEPEQAARSYSALACALIRACLDRVEAIFVAEHGRPAGGRYAVLGFGKLGSREMTATSDLDLVALYDFDPENPESDGAKPLHASVYYGRLTQRLIAALSAPTRRGKLFAVDMRLRPSGNQGPVAARLSTFRAYQAEHAEIWEHMALTRARPVAGDLSLCAEVRETIDAALYVNRDFADLAKEAREMRALIEKEKGFSGPWDLKLAPGGQLDIEFIAQTLALAHGAHRRALRAQGTADILAAAAGHGLDPHSADQLREALALFSKVTQWLRLSLGEGGDPVHAAEGVKRRLAAAAGSPDFARLERELGERRKMVRRIFDAVMGAA
ncbi:glutamate-ammonia-ligase adenylyltransferase [Rhodoblastus acidophilus]|uniref:Bifunctional glutamine synthetase adenylyltransferase/adenylyl-removing enzyme n=1 Tax=Rhodoblastus acidophilus TaxID=1074 RepID=A0A212RYX3_RHOAC|nr:bifunctional [glutamine synthetase] adenylyltransferase/[glutamine synthetase]-adenylyl-L-tyrosine phosphorylase [Rhodoblastus acidophilus]PPQ36405.1 bifunctional glutamine synthetase adenylyltransferase/deadenyltransferase [Rhodoblastus acidophilus]RAI17652.1 bifunctional glutamine synthetase adenylyltransferase/deadenyltransferase [Rhodoblastus acidophilus]SNB77824.1 glutamate-ammonia-ligase adenylyltransferase [Rhodoblastus acidophilus]